jgi:glycosyl transferase family 25
MIPVYCINLKRASERKELIIRHWSLEKKIPIIFFDAIDRRNATSEELPFIYNDENAIDYKKSLCLGEICCLTSHCLLLQKLIKENIKEAIIIEDDALPLFEKKEDLFDKIKECKLEKKDLNILLLHKRTLEYDSFKSYQNFDTLNTVLLGAESIYYTKEGMIKAFNAASKMITPMDLIWDLGIVQDKELNISKDALVRHLGTTSYIDRVLINKNYKRNYKRIYIP